MVTFVVGFTYSLWPQKVTGSLDVAMTYFMTAKVNLTFDLDLRVNYLTWHIPTDVQAKLDKITVSFVVRLT